MGKVHTVDGITVISKSKTVVDLKEDLLYRNQKYDKSSPPLPAGGSSVVLDVGLEIQLLLIRSLVRGLSYFLFLAFMFIITSSHHVPPLSSDYLLSLMSPHHTHHVRIETGLEAGDAGGRIGDQSQVEGWITDVGSHVLWQRQQDSLARITDLDP